MIKSLVVSDKTNQLILFIFLFTTLSGAVRKWVFQGGVVSNAILGIQLIMPLLFLFLPLIKRPNSIGVILRVYIFLLFPMIVNPLNHTYYHGVIGFVLHLGMWIPFFYYFNNRSYLSIDRLIPVFILITIAEISLAMVQYSLPFEHFLNRYANESIINHAASIGDSIRVTGSFSYIGGFGSFMFFASCLIHIMIIRKTNFIITYLVLMLGLMGAFMSGYRAVVGLFVLVVFSAFVFSGKFMRQMISLFKGGVILIFVLFFNSIINDPLGIESRFIRSYDNFTQRVERSTERGEGQSRLSGPINDIINFRGEYWLFGIGLGSTYQGANAIWGESIHLKPYGWYEEEPERILLEGGWILFLIRVILFVVLGYFLNIPLLLKAPLLILIFVYFPIVFNTFNAFYIFLGLSLLDIVYNNLEKKNIKLVEMFTKLS